MTQFGTSKTLAVSAFSLAMLSSFANDAQAATTKWTGGCTPKHAGDRLEVSADFWFTPEVGDPRSEARSVNFWNVNMWVVPWIGKGVTEYQDGLDVFFPSPSFDCSNRFVHEYRG